MELSCRIISGLPLVLRATTDTIAQGSAWPNVRIDRNVQYEWFQNALRLREVDIWDFSRLNFIRTVLSKRKLTKIVNEGKVWGWDDPRMPTIRGITRRGMTVNAFREFILKQGPSRNVLNLEWGAFWALNKKYIDPSCPRHTAIIAKNAVRCTVAGIDAPGTLMKPRYHKNPELGMKKVLTAGSILLEQVDAAELTVGEEITLMNCGNAFVRDVTRMDAGGPIAFQLHLEGDVKKTKKVTWLADVPDNLIPVDVVSFDYLITKNKLEKSDTIEECLTPTTEFRDQAFADCNVAELQPGAMIQFERKGYYILDNLEASEVKPLETRGLEHLSISWTSDVVAFFQEYFQARWEGVSPGSPARKPWSDLLTLTLTCSDLRPSSTSGRKRQRNLLRAAAVAARLMPQLKTLQIWNCGSGSGALFEFRMREDNGQPPLIWWMSTWPTQFTPQDRAFECWRTLARERDFEGREPDIDAFTTTIQQPEEFQSKWGLRHYLNPDLLRLMSKEQIRWEEKITKV